MTSFGPESPVEPLSPDRIIMLYNALAEGERHFNEVQSQYRTLASAWLLASLGASGFLLFQIGTPPTSNALATLVSSKLLLALAGGLCLSSSIGVALLWWLDRTYQRLIGASFNECLALEEAFDWLPQVRHRVRAHFKGTLPRKIFIYYLALSSYLWIGGTALLVAATADQPMLAGGISLAMGATFLIALNAVSGLESVKKNIGNSPTPEAPPHDARVEAFKRASLPPRTSTRSRLPRKKSFTHLRSQRSSSVD